MLGLFDGLELGLLLGLVLVLVLGLGEALLVEISVIIPSTTVTDIPSVVWNIPLASVVISWSILTPLMLSIFLSLLRASSPLSFLNTAFLNFSEFNHYNTFQFFSWLEFFGYLLNILNNYIMDFTGYIPPDILKTNNSVIFFNGS